MLEIKTFLYFVFLDDAESFKAKLDEIIHKIWDPKNKGDEKATAEAVEKLMSRI